MSLAGDQQGAAYRSRHRAQAVKHHRPQLWHECGFVDSVDQIFHESCPSIGTGTNDPPSHHASDMNDLYRLSKPDIRHIDKRPILGFGSKTPIPFDGSPSYISVISRNRIDGSD
ncbi:hypothetical protein [Mesorhizobium sp. M7A.F.Ca.MR.362.00.0.0]|uniref:hypothetical protein n=1 Tax=Mesorhizobium sp. M7A.F.Ca.MR.362.00.0.0 TaxID=2496779 RepID=UPI000FD2C416|nr:hypothetical protein [Mesorhizobium sp. M7A.F.Ca.MR.362.00.0.0]RUU74417.1 hypothetical protein EOC06_33675 [Mesorhizobium sp. M7A.F.Ca.MR.362.00.0.0]